MKAEQGLCSGTDHEPESPESIGEEEGRGSGLYVNDS